MRVYHKNSCRYLKELQNTLLRVLAEVRNCISFGLHRFPDTESSLDDLKQQEARIRRGEGS